MISICILTKDCEQTLPNTLASTESFNEVLVLDSGSTDETVQRALAYPNVRVVSTRFKGFGPLRNEAAQQAKNDWILQLDSDEVLSDPLLEEIQRLQLDPARCYRMARHNFYNGKRIIGCGWGGDSVVRLYHKKRFAYKLLNVHESLNNTKQEEVRLKSPIYHTPYRSWKDFRKKKELYSTLFAEQNRNQKKGSTRKALSHAAFAFFKGYFLQAGFLSGLEGFLIARYNAEATFSKYEKLKNLQNKQDKTDEDR